MTNLIFFKAFLDTYDCYDFPNLVQYFLSYQQFSPEVKEIRESLLYNSMREFRYTIAYLRSNLENPEFSLSRGDETHTRRIFFLFHHTMAALVAHCARILYT